MLKKFQKIQIFMSPYKGVFLFLALLFIFHYFWKITVDNDGSETGGWIARFKCFAGFAVSDPGHDRMYFLGCDVTPDCFKTLERWLVAATGWFVRIFPTHRDIIIDGACMYFPERQYSISIVWGCLGVKQLFIFAGIMLFYYGPFLKKLWYIPLGCVVLTVYNVIRIGLIVILTRDSGEFFEALHDGVFRYLYYVILFIIWVVWVEFMTGKGNEKHKAKN
ncbi:MAG: exosortase/archaeosortase family protein [Dysgonamonadaceae bacterium]|jgi:exosortase/archaeosortase family protein|nr:exosortase/archaeosortase family protein [Dysgonamonadaceae bacterium]